MANKQFQSVFKCKITSQDTNKCITKAYEEISLYFHALYRIFYIQLYKWQKYILYNNIFYYICSHNSKIIPKFSGKLGHVFNSYTQDTIR
jgi:hypothetical protein